MGQGTKNLGNTPKQLQSLYAPISEELEAAERILREELRSKHSFVDRLVKHGFRLGGKRLRPALLLLAGKACGELKPEHRLLAAVVEMVHTATLIHDDVLDEATIRRHLDTVNARWDNEASVLLGDYLFSRSICLASSLETTFACRAVAEISQTMCEGELRQIGTRGNYDLSESDYLEIIADKTAALCACCCRLGAHYAGADPDQQEALARFGHDLGIAFQIVDDVLDVVGDESTTGKSLGTDLLKQKATLPLIRLLDQVDSKQREDLIKALSGGENHRREVVKPWLERSDAISYAREKATWHIQRATGELQRLPSTPSVEALKQLAEFVVNRRQ